MQALQHESIAPASSQRPSVPSMKSGLRPSLAAAVEGKLAGKRILIATDDRDFDAFHVTLKSCMDMSYPYSHHSTCDFSHLLAALPELQADVLLILSPLGLKDGIKDLESGLKEFRRNNPGSVVLMNNLHTPISKETGLVEELVSAGLVDHVEQGFMFFSRLLDHGAALLQGKV